MEKQVVFLLKDAPNELRERLFFVGSASSRSTSIFASHFQGEVIALMRVLANK